jgi:hypothetical protein
VTEERSEQDQHYRHVVAVLAIRFAGVHEQDTVLRAVAEARAALTPDVRALTYPPLLALKMARSRLTQMAPSSAIRTYV